MVLVCGNLDTDDRTGAARVVAGGGGSILSIFLKSPVPNGCLGRWCIGRMDAEFRGFVLLFSVLRWFLAMMTVTWMQVGY